MVGSEAVAVVVAIALVESSVLWSCISGGDVATAEAGGEVEIMGVLILALRVRCSSAEGLSLKGAAVLISTVVPVDGD